MEVGVSNPLGRGTSHHILQPQPKLKQESNLNQLVVTLYEEYSFLWPSSIWQKVKKTNEIKI